MIKHMKGDLLTLAEQGHFDVIVHGCNCQNTMGSGIARQIRERYPEAYDIDTNAAKLKLNEVGNYSSVWVGYEGLFCIVNAYTQNHYLPRGIDHFDYDAFKEILEKLAVEFPACSYGFPYIGMSLAGGNKIRIMNILDEFALEMTYAGGSVTLVEYA